MNQKVSDGNCKSECAESKSGQSTRNTQKFAGGYQLGSSVVLAKRTLILKTKRANSSQPKIRDSYKVGRKQDSGRKGRLIYVCQNQQSGKPGRVRSKSKRATTLKKVIVTERKAKVREALTEQILHSQARLEVAIEVKEKIQQQMSMLESSVGTGHPQEKLLQWQVANQKRELMQQQVVDLQHAVHNQQQMLIPLKENNDDTSNDSSDQPVEDSRPKEATAISSDISECSQQDPTPSPAVEYGPQSAASTQEDSDHLQLYQRSVRESSNSNSQSKDVTVIQPQYQEQSDFASLQSLTKVDTKKESSISSQCNDEQQPSAPQDSANQAEQSQSSDSEQDTRGVQNYICSSSSDAEELNDELDTELLPFSTNILHNWAAAANVHSFYNYLENDEQDKDTKEQGSAAALEQQGPASSGTVDGQSKHGKRREPAQAHGVNTKAGQRVIVTRYDHEGGKQEATIIPHESGSSKVNPYLQLLSTMDENTETYCPSCRVTCYGVKQFTEHFYSKKHKKACDQIVKKQLEDAENAGQDVKETSGSQLVCSSTASNKTYVGLNAQVRSYCDQVISNALNTSVFDLLKKLLQFQERVKQNDPIKAHRKKRLVSGLREVSKSVKSGRAQCIIVAPNIEQISSTGGLDQRLADLMTMCMERKVPVVFALSRKKLGMVFGCRKKMSVVAILDYSGADPLYKKMLDDAQLGKSEWDRNRGPSQWLSMYQESKNANAAHTSRSAQEQHWSQSAHAWMSNSTNMNQAQQRALLSNLQASEMRSGERLAHQQQQTAIQGGAFNHSAMAQAAAKQHQQGHRPSGNVQSWSQVQLMQQLKGLNNGTSVPTGGKFMQSSGPPMQGVQHMPQGNVDLTQQNAQQLLELLYTQQATQNQAHQYNLGMLNTPLQTGNAQMVPNFAQAQIQLQENGGNVVNGFGGVQNMPGVALGTAMQPSLSTNSFQTERQGKHSAPADDHRMRHSYLGDISLLQQPHLALHEQQAQHVFPVSSQQHWQQFQNPLDQPTNMEQQQLRALLNSQYPQATIQSGVVGAQPQPSAHSLAGMPFGSGMGDMYASQNPQLPPEGQEMDDLVVRLQQQLHIRRGVGQTIGQTYPQNIGGMGMTLGFDASVPQNALQQVNQGQRGDQALLQQYQQAGQGSQQRLQWQQQCGYGLHDGQQQQLLQELLLRQQQAQYQLQQQQ